MKRQLLKMACITLVCLNLAGCLKFLFEGESAPLNKKIISVTVPSEKIPPNVKPLPEPPSKEKPTAIPPPAAVDRKLLPKELPDEVLKREKIPLEPARPSGSPAFAPVLTGLDPFLAAAEPTGGPVTLIAEDTTWRGTVELRGAVVVAPQATLRIEAGTVVRFAAVSSESLPSLVVQGRIHCSGSAERPVIMGGGGRPGSWGGVVLLATDKRNLLEQCRIEDATVAVTARHSNLTIRGVTVTKARYGLVLTDSVLQAAAFTAAQCDVGITVADSELELRDSALTACRIGIAARRSALVFSSSRISDCEQYGLQCEDTRLRLVSCELSANGHGAALKGGEGQITSTRFLRNRECALQLAGARLKVTRCLFADNQRDAVRLADGQALVWNSSFAGNGGYNLVYSGREAVTLQQNWWGSADEAQVMQKIAAPDLPAGLLMVYPWLAERPAGMP